MSPARGDYTSFFVFFSGVFFSMKRLSFSLQKNILHLYFTGVSQREIARRMGISRRHVAGIVGTPTRENEGEKTRRALSENSLPRMVAVRGGEIYARCPECGCRAVMPCRSCALRVRTSREESAQKKHTKFSGQGTSHPLLLNLKKREYQRYLDVKRGEGDGKC